MESKKIIKYDIIANYLYSKYLNNILNPYEKIIINPTIIYYEVKEIFKHFETHKRSAIINRFESDYSRTLYKATVFNMSWIFDKLEEDITSETITIDNIKRLLAFIIYPDNLFMVFNLQKEISEFVIYKYDLCRSFIKLNFLNTTTKEYKILLTYTNKLENDIALNSGDINISLLKENEILKEKNKMLVNLIFNSTSINGSNNDSTKTIEYYKSENERLKELMKIIVNINKKYVNSLNNDIKDKLTVK